MLVVMAWMSFGLKLVVAAVVVVVVAVAEAVLAR